MTKIIVTILIIISSWTSVFGCLNTYQFKIFPVGVYEDNIISVDVKIRRTSLYEGNRFLDLKIEDPDKHELIWILYTYIATYDKNQKIQSLVPFDTVYEIGDNYVDTLLTAYYRGYKLITESFSAIELFSPDYISFCDFQKECNLISVNYDTIRKQDYLVYKRKKYPITIVSDTSYYAYRRAYHSGNTDGFYISSVRLYKSSKITIVLAHLETGQEISMRWNTDDSNKNSEEKDDPFIVPKEHKPDIAFKDIDKAVFQEPLLHHGYGFDIFIVQE